MPQALTVRTPACACPKCRHTLDAATDPEGIAAPKPNDVSVCIWCGEILQFDENLKLSSATQAVLEELSRNDLTLVTEIRRHVLLRNLAN